MKQNIENKFNSRLDREYKGLGIPVLVCKNTILKTLCPNSSIDILRTVSLGLDHIAIDNR